MEASAIVKGTRNMAAAQKLMDFSASKAANELYSKYYNIVAHPDVKGPRRTIRPKPKAA